VELRPAKLFDLLDALGAFHDPSRLETFVLACEADARGRTGLGNRPYPQAAILRDALAAARSVSSGDLDTAQLSGPEIGTALRERRIAAIRAGRAVHSPP
jgi:tRNA nucleotidyltransferase (CCA-adding enzyme)